MVALYNQKGLIYNKEDSICAISVALVLLWMVLKIMLSPTDFKGSLLLTLWKCNSPRSEGICFFGLFYVNTLIINFFL